MGKNIEQNLPVVLIGHKYHRRGFTSGVALYSSCAVMTGVKNWILWIWLQ